MDENHFDLPPYTHVPGKTPHPFSDPAGHSFSQSVGEGKDLDVCLQRGLFLFENSYFWEAHEAWEQGWILLGRSGAQADFVKGLIKLAASGVKCLEENKAGAERHLRRAKELFHSTTNAIREEYSLKKISPEELVKQIEERLSSLKE